MINVCYFDIFMINCLKDLIFDIVDKVDKEFFFFLGLEDCRRLNKFCVSLV